MGGQPQTVSGNIKMSRERFELTAEERKEVYSRVLPRLQNLYGKVRPIEATRIRQLIKNSTKEQQYEYVSYMNRETGETRKSKSSPLLVVVADVVGMFASEFTGYYPNDLQRISLCVFNERENIESPYMRGDFREGEYLRAVMDSQYKPAPTLKIRDPLKINPKMPNLAEIPSEDLWKWD